MAHLASDRFGAGEFCTSLKNKTRESENGFAGFKLFDWPIGHAHHDMLLTRLVSLAL